jgi:hypothetical protein
MLGWLRRGAGFAARCRTHQHRRPVCLATTSHVGGAWRWFLSARKRAARKRRRKSLPPWGGILGGKPIERQVWNFDEKIELGEEHVRRVQHLRMLLLKKHYKIGGGDYDYPIKGVAPTDWLPWYELALAIASEFDDGLKVVDAPRPTKTSRRWRGLEGYVLLQFVNDYRKAHPNKSEQWYLAQLQKHFPNGYGKMPLRTLVVKYQEAKRYWGRYEAGAKTYPTS